MFIMAFIITFNIITAATYDVTLADDNVYEYQDFYYMEDEESAIITGYMGSGNQVVIPDEIDGIKVCSIGDEAFFGCEGIVSVELGANIESVGNYSFAACSNLKEVIFPDGLLEINEGAFQYCTSLEYVSIPSGVLILGNNAFFGCDLMREMYIPETVNSIGIHAFGFIDDNDNATHKVKDDFVLECEKDSYAYKYAKENGISILNDYEELSDADISIKSDKFIYNGSKQKPEITVIHNGTVLEENIDYQLTYFNNLYVGTGKVVIKGMGYYKGEFTRTFTIEQCDINSLNISLSVTSCVYNSKERKPSVVMKMGSTRVYSKRSDGTVNYTVRRRRGKRKKRKRGK